MVTALFQFYVLACKLFPFLPKHTHTHTHTHTGQGDRGHLGLVSGRFYEQEKLTWFNQQGNFPGLSEAKAKRVELHTHPSVSLKFI